MIENKTVYLIDGSAYIYRAYHAIRGLTNSKGLPTNAIFGFTRMLIKLIEDRNPEYMVMFFDAKGPTFRHDLYENYKANRPPMPEDLAVQIPHIKEVTRGFNISVVEMAGYEADDLIGTLGQKAEKAGFTVVMVTGDKDFIQLITDKATVWDPMKDNTLDLNFVNKTYGIEPAQMIDVMGLAGDSADNIPGIPGIGPKTALALMKKYGNMQRLYDQVDTIPKKKLHDNIVRHKDQAFLSRKLVEIDTLAPVSFDPEAYRYKAPHHSRLVELFKEYEFKQLQQTFHRQVDLSQKDYQAVLNDDALSVLINRLEAAQQFAVDTETTSKNPMKADLVGLSFAIQPDQAFYIPLAHDDPQASVQLELAQVLKRLKPVLENTDIKKIGQNIKYDCIVLLRHGITLNGIVFDTMLASYLMNPSKRAHNLDQIALDYLDYKTITYEDVAGKGKNALSFDKVPLDKAVPYACEDADITLKVYHVMKPMLEEQGLTALLETVEMPLIPVLMGMEIRGISVDGKKLQQLSKSFEHQLEALEADIYSMAGQEFNIKSSQQLGEILFEKLQLPVQKKTRKKTGYSTDVKVLTVLADQHELPALIIRHRTLAKLKSTYTDALLDLIHPQTKRIHTSFNQTVTATGRLSSSDPNLQNIPIRSDEGIEIRRAFIPKPGWMLVSADYSQIELRILAHYADDKILIQAFKEDEDIHERTAAEVFQVFPSFITAELRRQAKVINFGIVYGMSPYGLSEELKISQKMAKTYIDNYFSRYKGVKRFMEQTIDRARQTKKTSTLLGRIRQLPDIDSSNKTIREFAERTAINTPIQGTAADLIKLAMIKVDRMFKAKSLKAAMLLSVHDEIVFEVLPEELETVKHLVKETMEGIWDLKVPLKVNVMYGKNWAEAH